MKPLMRSAVTILLSALVAGGCYVIPVDQHGNPVYGSPYVVPAPAATPGNMPVRLPVRLYPANDIARDTGVVQGAVTNMMTGKGRFDFVYKHETYTGEATRVSDGGRRGVASAYSPTGGYMSCKYQMSSPRRGAGECSFSDGAKYQMHVGN
jgi:hypothetical protein